MRMEWEERETQGAERTRWQERCSQVLLLSSLYWKVWDFLTMGLELSSPHSPSSIEGKFWKTLPH